MSNVELVRNRPSNRRQPNRDQIVERIERKLLAETPWLTLADKPIIRSFAQVTRLVAICYLRLHGEGIVQDDGTPRPMLERYSALVRTQAGLAAQLGLTPRSRRDMRNLVERELDLVGELANQINNNVGEQDGENQ